ncbi:hypothetical protein Leryth_010247 [Lithospermum erythrorhizon]|nr:hypothetical protein Leryth_010247 [Lithospermum erythrorhizon]
MQESVNPPPQAAVNGGAKRLKQPQSPWFVPPNHVALRLLCHVSRVGGLIGKSGSIIRQLQQETTAKIRIEDFPNNNSTSGSTALTPVDYHRVILIIGNIAQTRKLKLTVNVNGTKTLSEEQEQEQGDLDSNKNVEAVEVSPAQEALVRVFERVIEVAAESGGSGGVGVEGIVSCRLLVEKGQVGSLIGKGGKTIEMIKREAGCRVKVLNKERLPSCAMPNDEMVEVEGDITAVKKALIALARCLQDCPVNKGRIGGGRSFEQPQQEASFDPRMDLPMHRGSIAPPVATSSNGFSSGGQSMSVEGERAPMMDSRASIREVVFNILCPNDRVGGVIGKGGSIVKNFEIETGTAVSVGPVVAESAERLITISSMENPESRYSPAQSAIILLFSRFLTTTVDKNLDPSSKGPPVSARLVVQSNDVGCLLGKGGNIISETRKLTGAGLRIIGGDQVPKCATGNVEVVQVQFISTVKFQHLHLKMKYKSIWCPMHHGISIDLI